MGFLKRIKRLGPGNKLVTIKGIKSVKSRWGKPGIIIKLQDKQGVDGSFWIAENSFIIQQILDAISTDDYKEEYEYSDIVGKQIWVDIVKNGDYSNIANVEKCIEYDPNIIERYDLDDEDSEDDLYIEDSEDDLYIEDSEDDLDDLDEELDGGI